MVWLVNSRELRVGESTRGIAASAGALKKDRDVRRRSASLKAPLLFMGSGNLIDVLVLIFAITAWLLRVNTDRSPAEKVSIPFVRRKTASW